MLLSVRLGCLLFLHFSFADFITTEIFTLSLHDALPIYDGFFDRYRGLRIIAAHGGGALPYLVSRMDQCYDNIPRSEEHTSELQSPDHLVCRLLLEKKKYR